MAIHIYHSKSTRFDPGSVWCESRHFGDPAWWQHGTVCRPATSSGDCDITCLVGLVIFSLPMMPLPHLVNKTMVTASGSKCISLKSVNGLLPSWSGRTCEGWCACSYLLWRALAMALTNFLSMSLMTMMSTTSYCKQSSNPCCFLLASLTVLYSLAAGCTLALGHIFSEPFRSRSKEKTRCCDLIIYQCKEWQFLYITIRVLVLIPAPCDESLLSPAIPVVTSASLA